MICIDTICYKLASIVYPAWFGFITPVSSLIFVLALFSPFCPLVAVYAIWVYSNRHLAYTQGYHHPGVRSFFLWKWFRNYFPITLHKTVNLDASKCYLFAHHPHACLGASNFINFCTEASGASKILPGIRIHALTLTTNFWLPVMRELILGCGMGSVSAQSIQYKLTKLGPGQAVVIMTGGAVEAGLTENEDPYKLKLKDRKGFVKMALKTGTSLVPVFTFGETDIFQVVKFDEDSFVFKLQNFFYRLTGIWPIIFHGEFLAFPYRRPITTVVGKPIDIPLLKSPTAGDVDRYHKLYIKGLTELFNDNVGLYGDPTKKLHFV